MTKRQRRNRRSRLRQSRPLSLERLEGRTVFSVNVLNFENINSTNPWADIQDSISVGNLLYLVARDHGKANLDLWRTDGTPQGTSLLANLGPDDKQDRQLTNVNGTLYFRGHSLDEGFELWKSNGTAVGTAMVRSLKPGGLSSSVTHLTNLQGTLYFSGNGELIKSNGTQAGTVRVRDLHVGASDEVSELVSFGDTLYFTAKSPSGQDGKSLYRTTGTSSSTQPIPSATGTNLSELTQVGSQLFYVRNGKELWRYRPTDASPEAVSNAATNRPMRELVNGNGTLFFVKGESLWKSDGTPEGTEFLVGSYEQAPRNLHVGSSYLYFSFGDRGSGGSGTGQELWRSDGTTSGTVLVKNINPRFNEGYGYGSYPNAFAESGGVMYFQAFDGQRQGIWATDGTESGTRLFESSASGPVDFNGQLFYTRLDRGNAHLLRLPLGQTTPLEVARSGPGLGSSNPSQPVFHGGSLYFFAEDGTTGEELRRRNSDGSIELIADITPGPADTLVADMESINGLLYFSVLEPFNNASLWRSDGTNAGTFRLASVRVTANRSDPAASKFVVVNGTLYFSGESAASGNELWKSDGTVAGTLQVKDIFPGSTYVPYEGFKVHSSSPTELTNFQGTLVFAASDGENGRELWRSNGTTAGTTLLVDHFPGGSSLDPFDQNGSFPFGIRQRNGMLHYMAIDGTGVRFFESDGTPAGSIPKSTPIPSLLAYQSMKQVGDKMFFVGDTPSSRQQLWVSDGTVRGTRLVKDIRAGRYSEGIGNMTEMEGILYFTADDGIHGKELWRSDGTPEGTVMVQDIYQGLVDGLPASSNPTHLTPINGVLFFSARNGPTGNSLWRTNGTAPGVSLVPGNGTSNPTGLIPFGNRLVYAADSSLGRELFQAMSAPPRLTFASPSITYNENEPAKLLARLATLTDADSSLLLGGRLSVVLSNAAPGEELRLLNSPSISRQGDLVLSQGVVFGSLSPRSNATSLVFTFNQNATLIRVQSLIRAIAFQSTSDYVQAANRVVRFTLADGATGVLQTSLAIQILPVNDAPVISGLTPVSYRRNQAAGVAFAANANVSDGDSLNFEGGRLSVSVSGGDVAGNRIFLSGNLFSVDATGVLRRGSLVIGTVSANAGIGAQPYAIQFNRAVRASTVTELLKALRFGTVQSVSNQARQVSVSLSDGDGGTVVSSVRVNVGN